MHHKPRRSTNVRALHRRLIDRSRVSRGHGNTILLASEQISVHRRPELGRAQSVAAASHPESRTGTATESLATEHRVNEKPGMAREFHRAPLLRAITEGCGGATTQRSPPSSAAIFGPAGRCDRGENLRIHSPDVNRRGANVRVRGPDENRRSPPSRLSGLLLANSDSCRGEALSPGVSRPQTGPPS